MSICTLLDEIGDENTVDSVITERLVKSRADGVILFNNENIDEMIESIVKYKLPIVVIGKKISGDNIGLYLYRCKKSSRRNC
ncbi:MAG: hypothetical protein ACLTAI_03470 [Thomasclavelia sp.]